MTTIKCLASPRSVKFGSHPWWCILFITWCLTSQILTAVLWSFPSARVPISNKTDYLDISEILLKRGIRHILSYSVLRKNSIIKYFCIHIILYLQNNDFHDIPVTEILLKVALNIITLSLTLKQCSGSLFFIQIGINNSNLKKSTKYQFSV